MHRLHRPRGIFEIRDGNAWLRDMLSRENKLPAYKLLQFNLMVGKRECFAW